MVSIPFTLQQYIRRLYKAATKIALLYEFYDSLKQVRSREVITTFLILIEPFFSTKIQGLQEL